MQKMIPDCYWPEVNNGSYVSHEAMCVLNPYTEAVTVNMTLYFEDREKISGISVVVPAERTSHIRLDKLALEQGAPIPRGVPYAMVIDCERDIPIQYTRVDTTQPELTIATTII